ncbi:MAG: hypothetical protein EOP06_23165 [Proteobacteria bacterium]|nr:MAG: hypothetical protein EOP06_23165 [Pseudomonadota bacterium]
MNNSLRNLKKKHPNAKEVSSGTISLAAPVEPNESGEYVRRGLLCREGTFEGMFGEVTVTRDLLNGIAERYNRLKKKAQNKNDFAPILTDHVREVDRIKGRILTPLETAAWIDPDTGKELLGLYGPLRVDKKDAQASVDDGTYAHLSISFDEESFELYEVSFVAVEAATGSMVLSKKNSEGGKMNLKVKLASLSKKHSALAAQLKSNRTTRSLALKAIATKKNEALAEATAIQTQISSLALSIKSGQLKSEFSKFVLAGK